MSSVIGFYKGGLCFYFLVNFGVLKFFVFEQVFKNFLIILFMGGGKGGFDFDLKGKSDVEVMCFCQLFMSELYCYVGVDLDVLVGDIGVGVCEIGYLFGQYKCLFNQFILVLIGKGLSYGGSLICLEVIGFGCVYFVQEMFKDCGCGFDGQWVVIFGLGNVVQYVVCKVMEMGGKVILLFDFEGILYVEVGFFDEQWEYLMELKNVCCGCICEMVEQFFLQFFEGCWFWGLVCDIVLFCVIQNELDVEDVWCLLVNGCVCVVEGVNMFLILEVVDLFFEVGIFYVLGKVLNVGGVVVSGLEMLQNVMCLCWSEGEVDIKLYGIMQLIYYVCLLYGEEQGWVNYVKGVNIVGFVKVVDVMLVQGVV